MIRVVLAEPNFILRQGLRDLLHDLGADVVALPSVDEAIDTVIATSGLLLVNGCMEVGTASVHRLLQLQDLQVVLLGWRGRQLASWTRSIASIGIVDLTAEEDKLRRALQRIACGDSPGRPSRDLAISPL